MRPGLEGAPGRKAFRWRVTSVPSRTPEALGANTQKFHNSPINVCI
jgi:hypothetical protein